MIFSEIRDIFVEFFIYLFENDFENAGDKY